MGLLRELWALGLFEPGLKEEFGGIDANFLKSGAIIGEFAKADFNFAYACILRSLIGRILQNFIHHSMARDWLGLITAGESLIAIVLTELKVGSDLANMGFVCSVMEDYVIHGKKI